MNLFNKLKGLLSKSEIFPEALMAYYHRLPTQLDVKWFRDDGMIVGEIKDEKNNYFVTQGKNPNEFVTMVNDAVYTAYGIKKEYKDELVKSPKFYTPSQEEWVKLNNGQVKKSVTQLRKHLVAT